MEDVYAVLNKKAALDVAAQQSVTVTKVLDPEIDLGTLLCFDSNDFDTQQFRYICLQSNINLKCYFENII